MRKNYHALIIDDRPMMLSGIKQTLLEIEDWSIEVDVCSSYQEALKLIDEIAKGFKFYNLIIADIDLGQSDNILDKSNEFYLEEISRLIRNINIVNYIRTKDNFQIYKVIKKIRPKAFILEGELNEVSLLKILKTIENNGIYYSDTIRSVIYNEQFIYFDFDDIDREILYYLKKGVKTKLLPNFIPRSLSAIEKRKQKIKEFLVFENCSDDKLVEVAVERCIV